MKNLIKLSLCLLSFTFLLVSCGESSIKGKWTSADMNRCTSEMKAEMKVEAGVDEMLELTGNTMDGFAACACEKIEVLYESLDEANIALDGLSDEEAGMLILSCFGDLEDLIR